MRYMITAVLCIALACVGLAQDVFGALTFDQYTEKTREKFHAFAVTNMEIIDKRIQLDPLDDPDEIDRTATDNAFFELAAHYDAMLIGYPIEDFWSVGADTAIQSALSYQTTSFDGIIATPNKARLDLQFVAEHVFGTWIDNKSESSHIRILYFTSGATQLVLQIKFYVKSGGNLSEAANSVREGFLEELDNNYDKDSGEIRSEPFVKRFIKVLNYVKANNDWPDEIKSRQ